MINNSQPARTVQEVYEWIESQGIEHTCAGCGDCCNFTKFDHLLFVTGVELVHFFKYAGTANIKPMKNGTCPYRIDGKCTVYENRFAGCRIFQCKGSKKLQGKVMEKALAKLKEVGNLSGVDYLYVDLARGLESLLNSNG